MKILKRELSTATRNLYMFLSSKAFKKELDKFVNKSTKRQEFINVGNIYVTPELVLVIFLAAEEPNKVGFALYLPDDKKQYDNVAWTEQTGDIEDISATIILELLKKNSVKVSRLY